MTGSLADYYHWEETGRGIHIYMHAAMADRLQAEVLQNTQEITGILLGRTEEAAGKPATILEDFIRVPDSDPAALEAVLLKTALAACDAPAAPSIIGYYRSHLGEGLSLSPADLQIIESYFQSPASVFLLIKPAPVTKACTAGFFFWEDGAMQPEFSPLEVALGTKPAPPTPPLDELPSSDLPGNLAALLRQAALPQPESEPQPAVLPPPPNKSPRQWPSVLVRAATIVIATAALVVSVVTYLGAPRPAREEAASPAPVSMLGLQVERTPPDLLVTWNRSAREIAAASRATLSIHDGKIQRSLNLDRSQLTRGSFLYTPVGDDIQFRLEVFGADDGSLAQSIRVLLPSATGAPSPTLKSLK